MCGQYSYLESKQALLERYKGTTMDARIPDDQREVYYPGQNNIILLPNNKFYAIQWGFIPSFSKRPLINARLESILEKKTFINPFQRKRCIIPATAFYEFSEIPNENQKQRWQISVTNQAIFSMAGVCERYTTDEGESILTYAILTKESQGDMREVHDRVPVILNQALEEEYLNLQVDPKQLQKNLLDLQVDLTLRKV